MADCCCGNSLLCSERFFAPLPFLTWQTKSREEDELPHAAPDVGLRAVFDADATLLAVAQSLSPALRKVCVGTADHVLSAAIALDESMPAPTYAVISFRGVLWPMQFSFE